MKKYLLLSLLFIGTTIAFLACTEKEEVNPEFTNWKNKNETFFLQKYQEAMLQITQAKQYENWEEHTPWRAFLSYTYPNGKVATTFDSIVVKIKQRGTGTRRPLYTDSVSVRYAGKLIPTNSYPNGFLFDHSGILPDSATIFNQQTAGTRTFVLANLTTGFATACLHMHEGDLWRVYIPAPLAYKDLATGHIPAFSTLIFDIELVKILGTGKKD